jgi:cobalt-zinc-cadmium efflux system outer membrane protein
MSLFRAACAAAVLSLGVSTPGQSATPLSLDDVFARVIATHPDLESIRHAHDALAAGVERAAQRPPLRVGAELENASGTGEAAGLRGADLTLSIASVLERGDKRSSRIEMAEIERDALALLRTGRQLDLLAEVARRYLDVVAADAEATLATEDARRRGEMVRAAQRRIDAGGLATSVSISAEAARLRAHGDAELAQRRGEAARRRLSILWGESLPTLALAPADLTRLPRVPAFDAAVTQLADHPELQRFAHVARLREARLQLARTNRSPDLEWQLGVRRLQSENDWGLVGSVSIPLGSARRAEPEVRAAEAELAAVTLQREGQVRALQATLAEAWAQLDQNASAARHLDVALIPQLERAAAATELAFNAGAVSYLDWAQLQTEILAARRERLAAAVAAQRALIELQRLTGEPFTLAATTDTSP